MKYFGQSPYREFTATGRAVCLDIQHYIYTNKSLDAMEDAIGAGVSSSVIKTAEKVISHYTFWIQGAEKIIRAKHKISNYV